MRSIIFLLVLVCWQTTTAQNILIWEKVGSGRYLQYKESDEIRLTTVRDTFHIDGVIVSISDSGLMLAGNCFVRLNDIACVYKEYRSRRSNGATLMIAGGVLAVITSLNNAFHHKPIVDPLYVSIGVGLSSAGLLWYMSGVRRYSISRGWKPKVLDYTWPSKGTK